MSFRELSECGLLYVCVIIGLVSIALATIYYLRLCYVHCLKRGMTKEKINGVIKSTAIFSIVPSIAIVAGLVTLAAVIGLPYAWFRLSVIGSVAYELLASNMALAALNLDIATADAHAFGLMMWAMCLAITVTVVFNLFLVKRIHLGSIKLGGGDPSWKAISQSVFMMALLTALVVPLLGAGIVSLLTFCTSAAIGLLISLISTKVPWLGNFTLAVSLLGAMASSVLWSSLF